MRFVSDPGPAHVKTTATQPAPAGVPRSPAADHSPRSTHGASPLVPWPRETGSPGAIPPALRSLLPPPDARVRTAVRRDRLRCPVPVSASLLPAEQTLFAPARSAVRLGRPHRAGCAPENAGDRARIQYRGGGSSTARL